MSEVIRGNLRGKDLDSIPNATYPMRQRLAVVPDIILRAMSSRARNFTMASIAVPIDRNALMGC
jgi:hypothetical protein